MDLSFSGKWYASGLAEFERKSHISCNVAKHLGKMSTRIGLDKCRSLLSIGPGPGYVDVPLIRDFLPDLEQYYGVEPRADALQQLRDVFLKELSGRIKVDLVADRIEDWSGPPNGTQLDVILMVHVLYYIADRQAILKKCLHWLKPGGLLIINHSTPEAIFQRSAQYVNTESCQGYTSVQLVQDFHAVGIYTWIEDVIHAEIDVRNPTKAFIDLILNKEATPTEVQKFKEMTARFAPSGIYRCDNKLFIITK